MRLKALLVGKLISRFGRENEYTFMDFDDNTGISIFYDKLCRDIDPELLVGSRVVSVEYSGSNINMRTDGGVSVVIDCDDPDGIGPEAFYYTDVANGIHIIQQRG